MRDILYDFRRTFFARYTLIASAIIILVAVGTGYLVTSSGLVLNSGLDVLQGSFFYFGALSGVLIPILATLSSYFFYGKDKANNVLESIIALPVTRGRLIFSRFLANVSSMLIAFVIGVGVYQLILFEEIGQCLTLSYALYLIWAYFVEIAAFTGLVYLASQFLESQARVLGFALALILIFGLFWNNDISGLVLYFANIQLHSNAYIQNRLFFYAASPGGYTLFSIFMLAPTNGAGLVLDAASFGVTPFTVYPLGIAWALIPAAISILLGMKRD